MEKQIEIYNANQNNLKRVNVKIPLGSLTVICGLSGSGKSSLAFETLYVEGQRRYLQNLSNYLKQYIIQKNPPEVERILNLPPALALEQKNSIKSSRSTVASLSGLSDHLRLIFEKLAQVHCPKHKTLLQAFSSDQISDYLLKNFKSEKAFVLIPVLRNSILEPKLFFKTLQAKGLSRLLIPQKNSLDLKYVKEIEEIKRYPQKNFYILLDRFVIKNSEKERMRDSFNQAFDLPKSLASFRFAFSQEIVVQILKGETRFFSRKARCPECSYEFPYSLTSNLFNFSSPLGACNNCQGYGYTLEIDEKKVIPNAKLSLEKGAIYPFETPSSLKLKSSLKKFCMEKKIPWTKPWCDLKAQQRKEIWEGKGFFKGVKGFFNRLEKKKYKMHVRIFLSRYKSKFNCKICKGSRLKQELNSVTFHGKTFMNYMKMNLGQLKLFLKKEKMTPKELEVAQESFSALSNHLKYLNDLGLSYLQLDRYISTLSGGEFQRLNLSNQLGLCLSQVLYVLDEPTVGLHPRDTFRMIEILKELQKLGNTIVVVEHDQSVMENSDYVIEMGPESGQNGGEILWSGLWKNFLTQKKSNTVPYLNRKSIPFKQTRPVDKKTYKYRLLLEECSGHNLKKINLFIPLNRFVVLTGVSGSGKSSLLTQTLYPALKQNLTGESFYQLPYKKLWGFEFLKDVILMTQEEIGRSSRSSIVSYVKIFDVIRKAFANTSLAKKLGFKASSFSLNVDGGRCPVCKGKGYQEIDMVFMDSLKIECEECKGKRFKKDILRVRLKDKNIDELLNTTIEEARDFFRLEATVLRAFSSLKEVGLSYLTLGQSLSSLSGGERQRLKLSRELLKSNQEKTLYILDEPTKGLHFKELDLLINVIDRLVDSGASFLVIEHNLDFIKSADYVIDMGPEAGNKGGEILAEGSPEQIMNVKKSHTGRFLKEFMLPSR
ncbi:MAG: excinuclease ABC subunit UvrA [Bdellovibrionales bacterium]|nr:excinuclease ABC subunit UvrA [Bdellovibrionales bacterium]